jgi:peroxiredoxin
MRGGQDGRPLSGAVAVALWLALAGCAPVPPAASPGTPAPTVAFALADGTSLASETTRGDVVVLAFFTKRCAHSGSMLRAVGAIRATDPSGAGLTVVAVDEGDEPAEVAALVDKLGLRMRIAFDHGGAIATQLGLPSMPSVIVIDRDGVVRHVHGGYHGDEEGAAIAAEVAALLAAPRPSSAPAP